MEIRVTPAANTYMQSNTFKLGAWFGNGNTSYQYIS